MGKILLWHILSPNLTASFSFLRFGLAVGFILKITSKHLTRELRSVLVVPDWVNCIELTKRVMSFCDTHFTSRHYFDETALGSASLRWGQVRFSVLDLVIIVCDRLKTENLAWPPRSVPYHSIWWCKLEHSGQNPWQVEENPSKESIWKDCYPCGRAAWHKRPSFRIRDRKLLWLLHWLLRGISNCRQWIAWKCWRF